MVWDEWMWRAPIWLWALPLPLLLIWLRRLRQKQAQQAYADAHLWPLLRLGQAPVSVKQFGHWFPLWAWFCAWICLVIALAGPKIYQQGEQAQLQDGVDVLLILDVSRSMQARDGGAFLGEQSRFESAQRLAQSLARTLQPQDRLGLWVFAGSAHLVSPLSFDKSLIEMDLTQVSPGFLPLEGSWLEPAMIRALHYLEQNSLTAQGKEHNRAQAIVLLSDGAEPFLQPVEVAAEIASLPWKDWLKTPLRQLWVLGFGSLQPQPIPDKNHASGVLHHNGLPVSVALQQSSLQQLAQQSPSGFYWHSDGNLSVLQQPLKDLRQLSQTQQTTAQAWQWLDLGPWFIALSILFLASAWVTHWVGILVLAMAMILLSSSVFAAQTEQEAFTLYQQQAYVDAQQAYVGLAAEMGTDPTVYRLWFGAGASAYKAEDYPAAVRYFRQAAWLADADRPRSEALFNLGNSYLRAQLGVMAVEAYQQALLYQNPYPQAEQNLQLAQALAQKQLLALRAEQAQQMQQGEDGKGKSQGQGEGLEDAFYGTRKPSPSDSDEPGFGSDGDALGGNRSGEKPPLPSQSDSVFYRLPTESTDFVLSANQGDGGSAQQIQAQRRQLQNAEAFAAEVANLDSQQQRLLKRLFEAEAGFHAEQKTAHEIPGIQPW